jgi:hypothetical protein
MVPSYPTMHPPDEYKDTTWEFDTSEGGEFDALVFAAGKGSFYIKDSHDPDGIVHEMLFVGLGLSTGKGPIPFGVGGSFSTPDMYSAGVGKIKTRKAGGIVTLADFQGVHTGYICSVAGGLLKLAGSLTAVYFGAWEEVAAGTIMGNTWVAVGVGITWLPCIFTIDP